MIFLETIYKISFTGFFIASIVFSIFPCVCPVSNMCQEKPVSDRKII